MDNQEKRTVPQNFLLLKFGVNVYTKDGKEGSFRFDDASADALIAEFNSRSRDLVIAYLTNKINTPITDESNLNGFDGNCYTASTLGFVPQLLYMGMDTSDKDMRAVIPDLLDDMIQEKGKMEPGRAVNESMAALREVRKQY